MESFPALGQNGIQPIAPPFAIYHDHDFKLEELDVEVAFPVDKSVSNNIEISGGRELVVSQLPGIESAACTIHKGEYENLAETYSAIGQWIQANNYQIVGPVREIYLTPGSSPDAMTEIQFPVQKG